MIRRSLALGGVAAAVLAPGALAAPATVNLRVEGAAQTLFEGPVTTDGRQVDGGDGTGAHTCDGTNEGAHPAPGPTMGAVLDDAARTAGFTWFGTFGDFGIDDFFVRRIGPDDTPPNFSSTWSLLQNQLFTPTGGCQVRVGTGDLLLFSYGPFGQPFLKLSGPARAATGENVRLEVLEFDGNGAEGPAAGAAVAGQTATADGGATVSFAEPGVKRLKATRPGAVRSNATEVCVYAPGSGACDTFVPSSPQQQQQQQQAVARDEIAPRVLLSGVRDGQRYRRAPRVLSGRVEDDGGIHQVYLRLRMVDRGGCRWLSGAREVFTRPGRCGRARYIRLGDDADWSYLLPLRLEGGARYIVDVKVLDRALNRTVEQARFRVLGG